MKIKVGYADYTVKALPLDHADADAYGLCDPAAHIIYITTEASPAAQASTLIHELIHACFQINGMPSDGLNEEDVCRGLEGPLTALFRDNPRLPGVIRKALTENKPIV